MRPRAKIHLDSPIARQLIAMGGAIESGHLANMRTYKLPKEPKIHTRIVGSDRTLCGRSLRNHGQFAWQFINRGEFANRLPSGSSVHNRDHCTQCAQHMVLQITQTVSDARRNALITVS